MGETEHGRHVFFIGVVVAGNAQKIAGAALGGVESGQDQVTVIVVTMEQKAVVSVDPNLPRQEAMSWGLMERISQPWSYSNASTLL